MTVTDFDITQAMISTGGSFVSMLGRLWMMADNSNRDRLKAAFPEEWERYKELVMLRERRAIDIAALRAGK